MHEPPAGSPEATPPRWWHAAAALPRLTAQALHRGLLPLGPASCATLVREGLPELHWKILGDTLVRFCQGAGPVAIKLGQILATREDWLPVPVCRRLERLYRDQPPMSRAERARLLRRAYPSRAEWPFADFERRPLAVGSIGQVHRARLRDGTRVVVKLLRPGIRDALARDLGALRALPGLLLPARDRERREHAGRVLDDLARALLREADLESEAAALEEFGKRLAGNPRVCVPACFRELSSRDALVLEELQGVPLAALRDSRETDPEPARRGAELALREILSQIFEDGRFHADPHGGNLLLLDDGRLGLIDLGLTGRLGDRERRVIAKAARAFAARDAEGTLQTLLELGQVPADFDRARFQREVAAAVRGGAGGLVSQLRGRGERPSGGPPDSLERLADELFRVAAAHGVRLPEETTLLVKALVTIEGLARSLDPEIDVVVKALPVVVRGLAPRWLRWRRRGG